MQNSAQDKLSIGQASEFLSVSIDTLRRWEKAGKIRTLRSPGGHRYFLKSDLERAFGQRYSRTTPAKEEVSKSTQLPQDETPLPVQPLSIVVDQPTATPEPADYQPPPTPAPPEYPQSPEEPVVESPATLQEENVETPPVFKLIDPPLPQTQEKRYTVEEIASPTQTSEPVMTQEMPATEPETYTPDMSQTPISPASESDQITETQKFDEPLSSFNTPPISPLQSNPQPSQAQVSEVTVTPQQKQGSSTLKKVSLFLLIVFMMVNIILIGFYIFVSRQL